MASELETTFAQEILTVLAQLITVQTVKVVTVILVLPPVFQRLPVTTIMALLTYHAWPENLAPAGHLPRTGAYFAVRENIPLLALPSVSLPRPERKFFLKMASGSMLLTVLSIHSAQGLLTTVQTARVVIVIQGPPPVFQHLPATTMMALLKYNAPLESFRQMEVYAVLAIVPANIQFLGPHTALSLVQDEFLQKIELRQSLVQSTRTALVRLTTARSVSTVTHPLEALVVRQPPTATIIRSKQKETYHVVKVLGPQEPIT